MDDCATSRLRFETPTDLALEVAFDGGRLTSDGGLTWLAKIDEDLGLCETMAQHVPEWRKKKGKVRHSLWALLRQRVFQIACGYEDQNDAQESLRAGTVEPLSLLEMDLSAIDWSRLTVGGETWRSWSVETLNKEPDTGEEYTDERFLADICQVLAAFINLGLENCEIGFLSLTTHSQPGKFALQIAPQNLVGAAYASYARVIAQRQEIKECPGCGRIFFPESGRQKYCTKSCASTSRWHRWKERQGTG